MLRSILTSMGIGAGLMYFYDPQSGASRRRFVRDKFDSLADDARHTGQMLSREIRGEGHGFVAQVRHLFNGKHHEEGGSLTGSLSQAVNEIRTEFDRMDAPSKEFLLGAGAAALVLYGLLRGAPATSLAGAVGLGILLDRTIGRETPASETPSEGSEESHPIVVP